MAKNDFSSRFGIELDIAEAQRRFVNRVLDRIMLEHIQKIAEQQPNFTARFLRALPDLLGDRQFEHLDAFGWKRTLTFYLERNFSKTLQAVELLWQLVPHATWDDYLINDIIEAAEVPLGIRWHLGKFYPQGDKLLDEKLVEGPLSWLMQRGLKTVAGPFEKALQCLLAGEKDADRLRHAVTDSCEALEAMAKIVTGEDQRDLSANAHAFLEAIGASAQYGKLLWRFIDLANRFRHAPSVEKPRPPLSYKEAEFFVYLTGAFLRLATS
jgi:hypothetical protein